MRRGEGKVSWRGAGGVIRGRGRARQSGGKTNENERATEPTDDVASRGTEVYASSGPFHSGPLSATTSRRIHIFPFIFCFLMYIISLDLRSVR